MTPVRSESTTYAILQHVLGPSSGEVALLVEVIDHRAVPNSTLLSVRHCAYWPSQVKIPSSKVSRITYPYPAPITR